MYTARKKQSWVQSERGRCRVDSQPGGGATLAHYQIGTHIQKWQGPQRRPVVPSNAFEKAGSIPALGAL